MAIARSIKICSKRVVACVVSLAMVVAFAVVIPAVASEENDLSNAAIELGADAVSSATGIAGSSTALYYSGEPITPTPTVTLGGATLVEGTDYTLTYANNINAGKATVTASGIGKYTGSASAEFTINPNMLKSSDISLESSSFVYEGQPVTPKVTVVSYGITLTEGVDYTLVYQGNTKIGSAAVYVTGKDNFQGTISRSFKIVAEAASDPQPATPKISISSLTVKGSKKLAVKWSKTEGASSYKVFYRVKGTGSYKSKQVLGTSATLTKLTKGKKYQVYVAALDGSKVLVKSAVKVSGKIK